VRKLLPMPPLHPSILSFIFSSSSLENNFYLPWPFNK
jgi:hypothetical protein